MALRESVNKILNVIFPDSECFKSFAYHFLFNTKSTFSLHFCEQGADPSLYGLCSRQVGFLRPHDAGIYAEYRSLQRNLPRWMVEKYRSSTEPTCWAEQTNQVVDGAIGAEQTNQVVDGAIGAKEANQVVDGAIGRGQITY